MVVITTCSLFAVGDQCSSSNCSQFCMEKGNGNYECACGSGYILEADKHGCKLKSRREFVGVPEVEHGRSESFF